MHPPAWQRFQEQADRAGLHRIWVVSRETAEAGFAGARHADGTPLRTPAGFHPGYRRAALLASPGRAFWKGFRRAAPAEPRLEDNPLDDHTARVVEPMVQALRDHDPAAAAVYPFRHPRQLLGFGRLAGPSPWNAPGPFGVVVDPHFGPWFVWRAAVLTALDWPETPLPAASPCAECPAPCVAVCPPGAAAKSGFDWEACANFRLGGPTCREGCLARNACPVGSDHRYSREQTAYHYRASYRMLQRWARRSAAD